MLYKILISHICLICALSFIYCAPSCAQPPPNASQATRETDRFATETEKQVERELRKTPKKPVTPTVEEEKPKEGEKRFFVNKIELVGCETFPPEDFATLIQDYENREITLTDLNNLSRKIASEYIKRGVIAAVFLPPQEVRNQTVTLQVVEARMGELQIQKPPFFRKKMLKYYWGIKEGEILRYYSISKSLQMMNKNSDREVKAALHAGSKPGYTDVILTSKTNFPIHGMYTFDREGIMTTGKIRNGFGIRDNNALGYDDSVITGISFGKNFRGIYGYHSLPISPNGASILYGYSYSISTPKKDYSVYSLKSEAENTTFSVNQDLYFRDEYLGAVSAGFNATDKVTWWSSGVGTLNKDRLRVLNINGNFVMRGTNSVTYISPELDQGINAFGASKKNNPLASRLGATPTYTKFQFSIQNRTSLPFNLQQNLKFRAQLASEKLFSQEQFGLGGIDTVRGYPPSDYLADRMALFNAEMLSPFFFLPNDWRLPYAKNTLKEQAAGVAFFDYGYGEQKGNPKPFRLSSVGVGMRMSFYDQVFLRLEWGFPLKLLGQDPLTEGKSPARFHISLSIEDKIPEEVERIIKEMKKEAEEKEAWALVDAELARPDSPIRKKMVDYFYLAEELRSEGNLKEARNIYVIINNICLSLYREAEEYVLGCRAHEKRLYGKSDEAMAAYKGGRLEDAKRLWEEVIEDSKPRSLELEY